MSKYTVGVIGIVLLTAACIEFDIDRRIGFILLTGLFLAVVSESNKKG